MFGVLPAIIDPIQLADDGSSLEGEFSLDGMSRLREMCRNTEGRVRVRLRFECTAQKVRVMQGVISARLDLTCQRCLQAATQEMDIATRLLLLRPGESRTGLPEEADILEVTAPVSLCAMVEDELLLALPMTPRHSEGECAPAAISVSRARDPRADPKAPASPFSGLADLKRKE